MDNESSIIIVGLIAIVVGVFQIILFFKLWQMTDDVREIKDNLLNKGYNHPTSSKANNKPQPLNVQEVVKLVSTGETLIIKKYEDDTRKYVCYTQDGKFKGRFSAKEIETINNTITTN